jgi:hypothetical protein
VNILCRRVGNHTRVWLFGFRVGDTQRDGDVDFYLEAETVPASGRATAKLEAGLNTYQFSFPPLSKGGEGGLL